MDRLSSRGLIKLHALFQVVLAVYLTWMPEVITDSGLIGSAQDEFKVTNIPAFKPPRSPFAYCGILLLIFALFDLTLAIKLPTLNHILTIARCIRRDVAQSSRQAAEESTEGRQPQAQGRGEEQNVDASQVTAAAIKISSEFSTLYRHLCVLLTCLRAWIFIIVSLKIYTSEDGAWLGRTGPAVPGSTSAFTGTVVEVSTVEELKNKVVLGYGLAEVLFSIHLFTALLKEQLATERSLRSLTAGIL